jgi:peptidoglycan/xylan/chitin deacetylase (PgdA/CDA1 family)
VSTAVSTVGGAALSGLGNTAARAVSAGVVTAAAAHAAPAVTGWTGLRRRVWPGLAGLGAADGVALTFDDGPDPEGTPAVLAALAALGWRATFFLLGSQVRRYPELARAVVVDGHEVALHGDEHRLHLRRTPAAVLRDLERGLGTVTAATGARPRWYRPPYGVLTAGTLAATTRLGLRPVLWTAAGRDWAPSTPQQVAGRVRRGLSPGATVLLHDSDCTSSPGSWRATAAALPLLAEELRARGLAVRPLSGHLRGRT